LIIIEISPQKNQMPITFQKLITRNILLCQYTIPLIRDLNNKISSLNCSPLLELRSKTLKRTKNMTKSTLNLIGIWRIRCQYQYGDHLEYIQWVSFVTLVISFVTLVISFVTLVISFVTLVISFVTLVISFVSYTSRRIDVRTWCEIEVAIVGIRIG